MKNKIISLLTALAFIMLSAMPVCAVKLDGLNTNSEYNKKEYQQFFDKETDSGNNVSQVQAFYKTENTQCYILFNVVCDDVDENKEELKDNKAAGVVITAEGETLKADLTGKDYGGYDRNKLDFDYYSVAKTGGFSTEVRINFKDGIGDGKNISVKVMDGSGTESAMRNIKIKPPEEPPTASAVTTRTTTEKATKPTTEKTTKTTTEKTTKEKTTKPTTAKVTTTKQAKTAAAPEKTKREITHRAVTTTQKTQTAASATAKSAKTTKAVSTKFRAQRKGNGGAVTQGADKSVTSTGTVTFSYITQNTGEFTTAPAKAGDSSLSKKKIAGLVSATLVIAACALGTVAKKDKQENDNEKSEGS